MLCNDQASFLHGLGMGLVMTYSALLVVFLIALIELEIYSLGVNQKHIHSRSVELYSLYGFTQNGTMNTVKNAPVPVYCRQINNVAYAPARSQ